MPKHFDRSVLVAGAVALALVAFFASSALDAQEGEATPILVGTYEPQQVAQAAGFQQQVMQRMAGLQQRAQEAQQTGDQAAMQQIQAEAQQIQEDAFNSFRADLEAVMPQVAEATGAQIIATDVSYAAPGIATEDVTEAVIEAMGATVAGEESGS